MTVEYPPPPSHRNTTTPPPPLFGGPPEHGCSTAPHTDSAPLSRPTWKHIRTRRRVPSPPAAWSTGT